MSEACPALPDGWKVDEDWSEHECFYDEEASDEWCIQVYRVYGPNGEEGPGGPQPVEAVNAAIDAGLLPGQPRWRYSTEEELAAQRRARIDRAITWTQQAHARNIAAIPLESQQTAVVESSGPSERAAREVFAQEHPDAELLSAHERSHRGTFFAKGRVAKE